MEHTLIIATPDIMLNCERLDVSFLKGTRQTYTFLLHLFNMVLRRNSVLLFSGPSQAFHWENSSSPQDK